MTTINIYDDDYQYISRKANGFDTTDAEIVSLLVDEFKNGSAPMPVEKSEIIQALCDYFGKSANDDQGSYCDNGRWMSIAAIVKVIESV